MSANASPEDILESEILIPLRELILGSRAELPTFSMAEFSMRIQTEIKVSASKFCSLMSVNELGGLDKSVMVAFFFNTIAAINGALGRTYPYLVVLISFQDEGEVRVGVLTRASLPADLIIVSDEAVPFLAFRNKADMAQNRGKPMRVASEDELQNLL